MNDNTPMLPALRAAGHTPKQPRRRPVRKAKRFRVSFDPMMTIPLCCTIILALDALLG